MADVMVVNDIDTMAARIGINLSQVDMDSIRLPPDENFGVLSDEEDIHQEDNNSEVDTVFRSVIVVDTLQGIAADKFEKLQNVLRKVYSQYGVIESDAFWMSPDPSDAHKSLVYGFVQYHTLQEAELAKKKTNGCKLGKDLTLAVNMFDDFVRLMNVRDEWSPPETKPYTPRENLQHWLTDETARDQFVICAGSETEILWNDASWLKPEPVYKSYSCTEGFEQWSPLGTYFATLDHSQGAAVWGGASTFKSLMRFAHPHASIIDFSPGEKYLVTYSFYDPRNPCDENTVVIKIFDVRTGRLKREFEGTPDDFAIGGTWESWTVLKWAGGKDDKYFAKRGKNVISVYETDTFSLVGKKSIKVENVVHFSWSPTDPILALFVPESSGGNLPRVSLVQIPNKEELRQRNLFNASDCKMHWQSSGEYLAVEVNRYTKTKRCTYTATGFELFRIKEKDIPIEVLELENKNDKVTAFSWEPEGHRFAVIQGQDYDNNTYTPKSDNKLIWPEISFYSMKSAHNKVGIVSKLTALRDKQANALFWSPAGRFVTFAGLRGTFSGQLEFYDVDDLKTMATAEHYGMTAIQWDPTGRYVATAATSVDHVMEGGFYIWSFNGKLLYRILKDHLSGFSWRPRPPSFLSPEKEEEIAKNLKEYSKTYKADDHDVSKYLSERDREKRRMLKEEWDKWVAEWKRLHEGDKLESQKLREGEATSDEEEEYYDAQKVEFEEVWEDVVSFEEY